MYIQVAVNVSQVNGIFDYHLPPELEAQVLPGCLVVVPFGKQSVQGIVLRRMTETQVQETKPIEALLDSAPVLTPHQIDLAVWLASQTLTPVGTCLDLMLPVGLSQHADTLYVLNPAPQTEDPLPLTQFQQRLLALLASRGNLRGRQMEAAFPHIDWKLPLQALVRRGHVISRPILPPPSVRPKTMRTVQLACSPETAEAHLPSLGRGEALARRQSALRFLIQEPWPVAVSWVYASSGCGPQDLQKLAEEDLVILGETEIWRDPLDEIEIAPVEIPSLTPAQQAAWDCILPSLRPNRPESTSLPFILYGVTGSGKTEIYMRAVEETLRQGRQAIILVPEIALTPQTLRRFAGRFPGRVGLVHSRLSPGERYDTWRRARSGSLPVIIGPRSALFAPLANIGLIVVDECHDDSYYQNDGSPFYHAVRLAIAYAAQMACPLILGSATPPLDLMVQATQRGWPILRLPNRVYAHAETALPSTDLPTEDLPLPPVEIVDMRQELKAGNRSIFSRSLQTSIAQILAANQQAILFLNRRGSATYVFCRECGIALHCPRCDLPLTYHLDPALTAKPANPSGPKPQPGLPGITARSGPGLLICHQCSYTRLMPRKCPQCGSTQIRQYGAGTEKVESEVNALFPQARTLRWDAETTRQKGAHEIMLSHFTRHQADILIGTQMLAKGLDLPLVTLVGVVLADVGLNFPDFRANERTFQLLTQVAGRAGRGPLGGKAIFQTFQPEHPTIRAAANHDYERFYEEELEQRRRLAYPPYFRLMRIEVRDQDLEQAEKATRALAHHVQAWIDEGDFPSSELIGPVPCFFGRINTYYRWQFIIRSPDPLAIVRGRTLEGCRIELDPPSLL